MHLSRLSGAALFAAIVGCSSRASQTCMPGQQVACACPGGPSGVQVCASDGLRMGPCDCGASKSSPPTAASAQAAAAAAQPPKDLKPSEPALMKCPGDFVARVERAVPPEEDDGNSEREAEKCTPGLFPEPGWAIVHRAGFKYYRAVLDAQSGRLVAKARPQFENGSTSIQIKRLSTIDFDGDGKSEILEVLAYVGRKGCTGEIVSVYGVRGNQLMQLIDFRSSSACTDTEESNFEYKGSYEITNESDGTRGILVRGHVEYGSLEATKGLIVGKQHLRFRHGSFVAE